MGQEFRNTKPSTTVTGSEPRENGESGPHVGLFYVVNGIVHWEGTLVTQAGGSPYFASYPKTHSEYWKQSLVRSFPELGQYDAHDFPRGRVVFDRQKDAFQLMADKCVVDDPELIERIVSEMSLPEPKVTTSVDINCECKKCRSGRVDRTRESKAHTHKHPVETIDDGRRLYRPWGKIGSGYVIPTGKRLPSPWLQNFVLLCLAFLLSRLIVEFTVGDTTGLAIVVRVALFTLFYLAGYAIWVSLRCLGLEKIDERDLNSGRYGDRGTFSSIGWIFAAIWGLIALVTVLVWIHYAGNDPETVRKQTTPAKSKAIPLVYTGAEMPSEVCSAIAEFRENVNTAIPLLPGQEAGQALRGAWEELNERLSAFSDNLDINEVKEIAAAFAQSKVRVKKLSTSSGRSTRLRAEKHRIEECLDAFKAMCPQ